MTISTMTPAQAREAFRNGLVTPTSGMCPGFAQANILAVPQSMAFDVLLFAQRNPKPLPILGVLEAGQVNSELLPGGDIRTDIPKYAVYRNGELVDSPTDVMDVWREDLVTFIIGCSFTFETALVEHGIALAHQHQNRNVPMYITSTRCELAGAMSGPLVVSMRPIPAPQVADAVRISSRYPAVHGAPVHVGDPEAIGITDLSAPDFGESVEIAEGHIPVFWACGVTPQAAVMESKPDIAIAHSPGHMLITDARDQEYLIP